MTPTDIASQRARLRSDIRLAARALPTHYPLGTFIAVNPLAGLQTMPFEQAVRRASDVYGMPGTLPEDVFRALHRQGRITDADLDAVLMRRHPNLADEPDLHLAGRTVTAIELLRADLLHGQTAPEPLRRFITHAERVSARLAADIDAHAATWCAAFLGGAAGRCPAAPTGSSPPGADWAATTGHCRGRYGSGCAPSRIARTTPCCRRSKRSVSTTTTASPICRRT